MKQLSLLPLILAVALATIVTGCKKTPKGVTPIQNPRAEVPAGNQNTTPILPRSTPIGDTPGPIATPVDDTGGIPLGTARPDRENMLEDRSIFSGKAVYFDFDRHAIKTSERSKLDGVAAYLKNEASHKLEIEGHCDERGTEEYNRALGERRALSAREYLVAHGIAADRIFTVSFGEDKPAETGHDEAAWNKNRRAEFVVLKPKP